MSGCYTCGGGAGKHDPVAHDWVPELTADEAERGIVLVQGEDGKFYVADTIVDPETGGVYAQPAEGAGPITVEVVSPDGQPCNGMCIMGNEVMPGEPARQGHNDDPRGGYYDWAAYPHPECPRHGA